MKSTGLLRVSSFALLLCSAPLTFAQRTSVAYNPLPLSKVSTDLLSDTRAASPQVSRLSSDVDLVNVVFSVEDHRGHFVQGFRSADFRVSEDGRPQNIRFFSVDRQVPLTMALLLDSGPSQQHIFSGEKTLSENFFQQVLTPRDLAITVAFDDQARLLQDFTSSKRLLNGAIDHARIGGGLPSILINPGPFPSRKFSGATHLWDAIYLSCARLSNQVGRKALIVVSNGDDDGSQYTEQDATRALLDTNTILYGIIASDPTFAMHMHGFGYSAAGKLRRIAALTGGRVYLSLRYMQQGFQQIGTELRSQYTLGYRPDRPMDGTFRKIQLALVNPAAQHAKLRIRVRKGYVATRHD